MTADELQNFMRVEQDTNLSAEDCELIIDEFEPSPARKNQKVISLEGFSRFFMFSDLHDIIDKVKTQTIYQVRKTLLRSLKILFFEILKSGH